MSLVQIAADNASAHPTSAQLGSAANREDPPWLLAEFAEFAADRHCMGRACVMITAFGRLLRDGQPVNPQALLETVPPAGPLPALWPAPWRTSSSPATCRRLSGPPEADGLTAPGIDCVHGPIRERGSPLAVSAKGRRGDRETDGDSAGMEPLVPDGDGGVRQSEFERAG